MANLNDERLQEEVIRKGWPTIAPFAFRRYLERGRGGILIKVSLMKLADANNNQLQIDGPVVYVTSGDVMRGDVVLPEGIDKEFQAYNPEHEVLFLFDDGVGIRTYRGKPGDQPTPKEMHAQKTK